MAPPTKHGFGKFPPISDIRFSDFAEKCGPPQDDPEGGGPHFEPPTRDEGSDMGGDFRKKMTKGAGGMYTWSSSECVHL